MTVPAAGYLHPDYSASFSEFGTPRPLQASQGCVIRRPIAGSRSFDAMGPYPLFCCVNWSALSRDLEELATDVVAIVVVADPLGNHSSELLKNTFDYVIPFKEHFIVETGRPLSEFVNPSHRLHAARALKNVKVELCPEPIEFIYEWERLYGVLAIRHSISGLRRLSRAAFERQLAIPGLVMFRATVGGETVGLDLWYEQGDCAQGHLAAFDSTGYRLRASYATKWRAIEYFNERVRVINLGAGRTDDPGDGLLKFKRGWSTGTKTAWLCGRVLQPSTYLELVRARGVPADGYFPAYRRGEFD